MGGMGGMGGMPGMGGAGGAGGMVSPAVDSDRCPALTRPASRQQDFASMMQGMGGGGAGGMGGMGGGEMVSFALIACFQILATDFSHSRSGFREDDGSNESPGHGWPRRRGR